jgi:argininosuccinate synthase
VRTVGRWSDHSLYSEAHVTFEEDAGAYDQKDAQGFIQLNALRLKLLAARDRRVKPLLTQAGRAPARGMA